MSDDPTDDLTSPGTIDDPKLERERAREAAARDVESRASSETNFTREGRAQEAQRAEAAEQLRDLPQPGEH